MELYIKNMVCGRCIKVVKEELEKLGLHPVKVELGEVELQEQAIEPETANKLKQALVDLGFEMLDSGKTRLIEKIKNVIIRHIFQEGNPGQKVNWSTIISNECFHDYNYLSSLFSSVEGITIEQYLIRQKIERVKEFLFYDELTLGEIAYKLDYSSVAHLSAQFKKVTGQTPSAYKKLRPVRKPIDAVK